MHGNDVVEISARLVLQLAFILLTAKIFGEVFERWLKQSPVLGELVAGMIIGPYALGEFLRLPGMNQPLFPNPHLNPSIGTYSPIPVSTELWVIGQIGAVALLFLAGVKTDFQQFLRYGPAALLVGVGGVVFPFIFGNVITVLLGFADSYLHPTALFMGAVSTATSVGITARVLSDLGRLATAEGVTVLAAAVLDDVLAMVVLAMVVSLVDAGRSGQQAAMNALALAKLALKSFGSWLLLTAVAVAIAPLLSKAIRRFRSEGALVGLGLALCFLAAGATEQTGLAMIIGAYALGLAFSRTDVAKELEEVLTPVVHALVPVFFAVMGMLVDFKAMSHALLFGVVMTLFAIIGKVVGCGGVALGVGFNWVGAARIGIGMLPRGEVALIIAGMGIAKRAIASEEFGVAIMFIFVTTFLAPILLVPLFNSAASGLRRREVSSK